MQGVLIYYVSFSSERTPWLFKGLDRISFQLGYRDLKTGFHKDKEKDVDRYWFLVLVFQVLGLFGFLRIWTGLLLYRWPCDTKVQRLCLLHKSESALFTGPHFYCAHS